MNVIRKSGTSFFDIKKNSSSREFPTVFTEYIKSFGEVYFWEKGNFHVVTKASHAREVLTSPAYSANRASFFISRMPNLDLALIKDFFEVVKPMMVMSDDGEHERRRKIAALGFEDHILEKYSRVMTETMRKLLGSVENATAFDFAERISKKLPSSILADLFSIPEEDRESFLTWSNTMTGFFGGASQYRNEDGIEVNEAAKNLKNYFLQLTEKRRMDPGEDYVSILVKAQESFKLSDDELISQLIMMLVAGMATTSDQMNNIMFLLATNPQIQEEIKSNLELLPGAIEELKRFDPAVTFIFRVARAEAKIGEQPIRPGDVIFISSHAINRDLPLAEDPNSIDVKRKGNHFAYGFGPHYCIGAKLGRLQMNQLFKEILTNLPLLELDDSKESLRDHYSLSFSGFKNLHLKKRS